MTNNRIALITGANTGIGFQIAKDLAAKGVTVLVGSRKLENGEKAAREIGSRRARCPARRHKPVLGIDAAAARISKEFGHSRHPGEQRGYFQDRKPEGHRRGDCEKRKKFSTARLDDIRAIYDTNVFGVIRGDASDASASAKGHIAAHRDRLERWVGSLTRTPCAKAASILRQLFGMYSGSKTALNAVMVGLALDLAPEGIKVNAACPGYTKTALNNFMGTRTVEEGAREPVRLALLDDDGPTGTYSNDDGPLPW